MASDVRIGISGWAYAPWRGRFYPKGLPQKKELAHAASVFRSIEINGTFYSMQRSESFAHWAEETPDDFVFAVKGPRYLTHMLRLDNAEAPLGNFFASGVLRLGAKLGPILWQFPPNFRFDPDKLETFFDLLPRDTLVCADTVEWPLLMDLTSDFVYVRLHGSSELYRSAYSPAALRRWAARVGAWRDGKPMTDGAFASPVAPKLRRRDVYLYFDNTDKLQAPRDALSLMRRLGQA